VGAARNRFDRPGEALFPRLRTDSEAAAAFYLALGFSPAAGDAHATHELAVARG
jgi:hypothetical protein